MRTHDVKLVTVVAARHLKDELIEFFRAAGITGYTYGDVLGKGPEQLGQVGSAETENVKFKILVSKMISTSLMKAIAERAFFGGKIIVFQQDASVLRPEKFGETSSGER